jgi:hypothetical protein
MKKPKMILGFLQNSLKSKATKPTFWGTKHSGGFFGRCAIALILLMLFLGASALTLSPKDCHESPIWGFFAHKRINRLAALTLPPSMIVFYKKHIEYITEHATDADARRYIVAGEGPKHFLDMDHFGTFPFANLPRQAFDAQMVYTNIYGIKGKDTTQLFGNQCFRYQLNQQGKLDSLFLVGTKSSTETTILLKAFRELWIQNFLPNINQDVLILPVQDSLAIRLKSVGITKKFDQILIDPTTFGQYGSLPWNLQRQYNRLVKAFQARDAENILKLSADIGHYIGDAHVPLHTVSNYNGQKSGQDGIHAFWESRLPELFADTEYDYFVGAPNLITNPDSAMWEMIFESHRYADTVLSIEKMLRISFPQREQMCSDVRSGKQILTQCRNYARAYQTAMDGLVERRMRDAIHHLSSIWYTAWMEAGQPDLRALAEWQPTAAEQAEWKELQSGGSRGKMIGRGEE